MTINYDVTQADHWALNRYLYLHTWRYGLPALVALFIIPAWSAYLVILRYPLPWFIAVPFVIVVSIIWFAFLYGLTRYSVWRRFKVWPPEFRHIELTVDEDGLHVATPKSTGTIDWSAVTTAARDRYAIYLFLSKNLAYIAPLRAFNCSDDADSFIRFAESHMKVKA